MLISMEFEYLTKETFWFFEGVDKLIFAETLNFDRWTGWCSRTWKLGHGFCKLHGDAAEGAERTHQQSGHVETGNGFK